MFKTALVTGASEGLGREFCTQLARQGFVVTGVARNETRLKELIEELKKIKPAEHRYIVADLGEVKDVEQIEEEIKNRPYSLLINNAGFGFLGRFYENDISRYLQMIALNITALTRLSHVFLKRAHAGDALINVSSTISFLPMPVQSVYAATKAYVTSLTESLWYESKKRDIFVLNICPGITATQFNKRAGGNPDDLPKLMTGGSEKVVRDALLALEKRKGPTLISGILNQLSVCILSLLGRKWRVMLLGRIRQ